MRRKKRRDGLLEMKGHYMNEVNKICNKIALRRSDNIKSTYKEVCDNNEKLYHLFIRIENINSIQYNKESATNHF